MKKFTLKNLFTIALGVAFLQTTNAQTWTIYDGSTLPESSTPAWTLGDKGTVYAQYSIVSEGGNSFLYETTAASSDKLSYKLSLTQPQNATWIIRTKSGSTNPASMEFEMNAVDGASAVYRMNVKLINNAKGGYLQTNYLSTNVGYPSDTTLNIKEFHTYRITVENGNSFKIYLDENATPIVTGKGSSSTQSQFLRFGDVGSNFSEGTIDWMAWDVTGAYAPGTTLPAGVIVDGVVSKINGLNSDKINISPNPVTNLLTIKNANKISKYEIIDINGKIFTKGINKNSVLTANVNNLKAGLYFIKIYSEGKTEQIKFIKK